MLIGDPEHGIVGERSGRVVVPDVLECLEGITLGVEQGLLAGEAGVPGELLLGLCLGVGLCQPLLGDGVLAADELVEEFGARVIGDELLVGGMGVDELAALVQRLGKVVLGLLAPGGPLPLPGDLGEDGLGPFGLQLGEEALTQGPVA